MAASAGAMSPAVTAPSAITKPRLLLPRRPTSFPCRSTRFPSAAWRRLGIRGSVRAPSSASEAMVATSTPQIALTQKLPQIGSPLLWIGVGIGLSAWFSVMATKLKRHAIHKAFKSLMGEEAEANGQFNTKAFARGSDLPSISEVDANIPGADITTGSEITSEIGFDKDEDEDEENEIEID